MGQRPRTQRPFAEGERDYKYQGIKDQNLRPHEQCEMEQDAHVVRPTTWPPVRIGNQVGEPSIDARCEDCGAWLQVYRGHAEGEIPGIKVILPQEPPAPADAPEPEKKVDRRFGPRIGRERVPA